MIAMIKSGPVFWIFIGLLLVPSHSIAAQTETVFTHRVAESAGDTRHLYEIAVLKLALEKTEPEYGPFRLEGAPRINVTRSIHSIRSNSFSNFFYSLGYEEIYDSYQEMIYIPFPIELGVLGYRTCFTSEQNLEALAQVTTLEELKAFSHGQGRGWVDGKILQHNGFKVAEVEQYDKLFKMVAADRFDLFCRGANEIKDEYDIRHTLKGLAYDRNILIYYPMPIFFYTHVNNREAIERVTKGLLRAYGDGSLMALWSKQHQASVDFADLGKRRIFRLDNPLVKSINFDHEQYVFKLNHSTPTPNDVAH